MENLLNNPIVYVVGVGIVIYILCIVLYSRNRKQKNDVFENENPTVSKIYVPSGMTTKNTSSEKLRRFSKGIKTGFYLLPGEHVINVSYTYSQTSRKTIVIKPVDITLEVEPSKEYELKFDKKEKTYEFNEK